VKSELLPEGWNELDNSYALRYVVGTEVYILHGILTEGTLLINLVVGFYRFSSLIF
jgi:PI31 proteasome regulator N-terminal